MLERMDNSGVNTGSIQKILGHESIRTTDIYLHLIGDTERNAMDIFEQVSQVLRKSPILSPIPKNNKKRSD